MQNYKTRKYQHYISFSTEKLQFAHHYITVKINTENLKFNINLNKSLNLRAAKNKGLTVCRIYYSCRAMNFLNRINACNELFIITR